MGVKVEITWRRKTVEGERVEINARRVGKIWKFFWRQQRFEVWAPFEDPPLEDWLELLNGVQRRAARQLLRPEEEARLRVTIRERFPEAEL